MSKVKFIDPNSVIVFIPKVDREEPEGQRLEYHFKPLSYKRYTEIDSDSVYVESKKSDSETQKIKMNLGKVSRTVLLECLVDVRGVKGSDGIDIPFPKDAVGAVKLDFLSRIEPGVNNEAAKYMKDMADLDEDDKQD